MPVQDMVAIQCEERRRPFSCCVPSESGLLSSHGLARAYSARYCCGDSPSFHMAAFSSSLWFTQVSACMQLRGRQSRGPGAFHRFFSPKRPAITHNLSSKRAAKRGACATTV